VEICFQPTKFRASIIDPLTNGRYGRVTNAESYFLPPYLYDDAINLKTRHIFLGLQI